MIKNLSKEDISASPFNVSKTWRSPGNSVNFLLTDSNYTTSSVGDNLPAGINYTDFRSGLVSSNFTSGSFNYYDKSFNETSLSLGYYPYPGDVFTISGVNESRVDDFNLVLEESGDKFINIAEGVKIEKYVRFLPESSSRNVDGTYKRLVYDQIKNSYYSDTKDPTKVLGLENIDVFLDRSKRFIGNSIKVATVPQAYFGDTIQKNSLRIEDNSQEQSITFVDDGDGNVITSGSVFEKIVKDSRHTSSLHPNVGYSVATSEYFSAVGCPSFQSNIIKTGSVDVYKKERLISDRFVFDKSLSVKTSSLSHIGAVTSISQSDFGVAVSIFENLLAVSTTDLRCSIGSTQKTASGFVLLYDLNNTSSTDPVQIISHSLNSNEQSRSFGYSVSMNDDYLVVGSPFSQTNGIRGSAYLFKSSSNGYVYQTFLTGSESSDVFFGSALEIDKGFNKIIIGNGSFNNTSSKVYLFESSSGGWQETKKFSPTKDEEDLFFAPITPYFNQNNTMDGFGNSVSIHCSSDSDIKVAIGAPYDRNILEYSGSDYMRNGAVYVFEKRYCTLNGLTGSHWKETRLIGDADNFHSNRFGHAVSIYGDTLAVSSPKYLSEYTSSYIKNTLTNSPIDNEFFDYDYNGILYVYTSSVSSSWDVFSKYKPKKLKGVGYYLFSNDVEIFGDNLITGDPMPILDTSIDSIDYTFSNGNVSSSFHGGFHIFDLSDVGVNHHVGNVFYRTGKIIFTSDSNTFNSVFESGFNDVPIYDISYRSSEKFFEKEIICTVNPGEFNVSTNPTSYEVDQCVADLNQNGSFDFNDCDFILRSIYKKNTGSESWWELFTFLNPNTSEEQSESSVFHYHVSNSFENKTRVSLIAATVPAGIYEYVTDTIFEDFDINSDGKTDELDIKILWKFFVGKLNSDNISPLLRSRSMASDSRNTFDGIIRYLNTLTGRGQPRSIKSEFLRDMTVDSFSTGSNLSPYVTTIGLYNGLDLIGVAKLGTPIKNQGYFPLNFIIRFDI